jgi:hypothetical protein
VSRIGIKARIRALNREHGLLLRVVIGVGAFLLVVAFLWWLVNPRTPEQRTAFIQTMGGIVGGSALLFGLYFTARNLQVNQQNLRTSQEGQITERFTRAIDQLGATNDKTGEPRLEVRIGGIYALERIARDSPESDYSTVMEVLTAYVRENTPKKDEEKDEQKAILHMRADIQAIMNVIGRRKDLRAPNELGAPFDLFDLRGVNLKGAKLRGAYLGGIDFRGAKLNAGTTWLKGAILRGADLRGTNLRGANLMKADLQGTPLWGAKLQGTHLEGADLKGAVLLDADLKGAYLKGADLKGARLEGADLREIVPTQLAQHQLEQASGDNNTKLPDHLKRPASWDVKTNE